MARIFAVLAVLGLVLGSSSAFAQSAEKRVALVIGNAAYKDAPLKNPVNDVRAMAAKLRNLGFDVVARENATRQSMESGLAEFTRKLTPGAAALVYYAGHGIQARGRNYLIPVDATLESEASLRFQAVDLTAISEELEQSKARVSFLILDACRNNPFERRMRGGARGLAAIDAAQGTLIAYATAPGAVAADGEGSNGVYTAALLKALDAPGLKAEEVFKRVRVEVASATKSQQTPWESSSLTGDFIFNLTVNVAPVVGSTGPADREALFWQSAQSSNRVEEYEEYLRQFPKGMFAGLARSRISSLKAQPQVAAAPVPQQAMAAPTTAQADAPPASGRAFRDCPECPEMVVVPAGDFTMGSPKSEIAHSSSEEPTHVVTVRSFALGKYEVTRGEFSAFVRETGYSAASVCYGYTGGRWQDATSIDWRSPGFAQTERDPVVCVSWEDAKAYVAWLSRKTGKSYRLPSEAEWEYAARAGTTSAWYWGEDRSQACGYANVGDRTLKQRYPGWANEIAECDDGQASTAPVGTYRANGFGLNDMLGNVWEWTEDCWNKSYDGSPRDGSAWTSGECGRRVQRGGGWTNWPVESRSAMRLYDTAASSTSGFRVARAL